VISVLALSETEYDDVLRLNAENRRFAHRAAYDGEEFLEFGRLIRGPFLYIDQIAIAERNRRAGIGRTLYNALDHAAATRGIHTLCCEVNT
jgi:predicted GNAT superfamily acetyltransferase